MVSNYPPGDSAIKGTFNFEPILSDLSDIYFYQVENLSQLHHPVFMHFISSLLNKYIHSGYEIQDSSSYYLPVLPSKTDR